MFEILKSLCTPAKIYLSIAFIVSIGALINGVDFIVIIVKMLFAGLWTYILNFMCKKGLKTAAWVIVLLPFVFMILALFEFFHLTHEQKMYMREYGIEISYEEGFIEGASLEKAGRNAGGKAGRKADKARGKAAKAVNLLKNIDKVIIKSLNKAIEPALMKALKANGCGGNDKKK
jgi:hypothetical protein